MAKRTNFDGKMSRSETADFLRTLADDLDSGAEAVTVEVGNKRVELSPPETINAEVEVTERSRALRKDLEELEIDFQWNPVTKTGSGNRDNGESETASDGADPTETGATENR